MDGHPHSDLQVGQDVFKFKGPAGEMATTALGTHF